ncbi:hypothetical protein AB5J49_40470 [Streptomyces sp. R28]|uniref:Uncharacterized protein n=1 Tax=Streptomyces sp. R28 TaxID=3238628 RepID=A0AB39Q7D3_9ACTN
MTDDVLFLSGDQVTRLLGFDAAIASQRSAPPGVPRLGRRSRRSTQPPRPLAAVRLWSPTARNRSRAAERLAVTGASPVAARTLSGSFEPGRVRRRNRGSQEGGPVTTHARTGAMTGAAKEVRP